MLDLTVEDAMVTPAVRSISKVAKIHPGSEFRQRAGRGRRGGGEFIRAPIIRSARVPDSMQNAGAHTRSDPVLVEQGRHLVATFHPELTPDLRVHKLFLSKL